MAVFWAVVAGLVVIGWTLREVFIDLFQPSQSGSLSSFLARRLFQVAKHAPRTLRYAGPLSIVVVIFCWIFLIAAGFALIFWSGFPAGFRKPVLEAHGSASRFWTMLYFSLASLTTLSSSDVSPQTTPLRMATAIESVIGISLVTASATWIILIYPALGRMRSLSRRTFSVIRAQKETGIDLFAGNVEQLLGELASSVIRVRVDLIYFPVVYYFRTDTEGSSLATSLLSLHALSETASHERRPEAVRLSSALLKIALTDIAGTLNTRFLPKVEETEPTAIFEAARRDHMEGTISAAS